MTSLLSDANDIRLIQKQVVQYALTGLDELFLTIAGLPPEVARNILIESLPGVAATYGDISAVAAGEWFETLREREVGSGMSARLAQPVAAEPVEQSVRFAAQHLFTDDPSQTEKYLAGQMVKWVNQPARETIIDSIDADPIGYGWQRVVRPNGCRFCRMLADRGGVYTRKTVWFASHANCNCGAVPSWDPDLPEVNVKAYEASKRMESVRRRAEGRATDDEIARSRANAGGKLKTSVTRQNRMSDQARAQETLKDHRARTRAWLKDMED